MSDYKKYVLSYFLNISKNRELSEVLTGLAVYKLTITYRCAYYNITSTKKNEVIFNGKNSFDHGLFLGIRKSVV